MEMDFGFLAYLFFSLWAMKGGEKVVLPQFDNLVSGIF